MFVLTVDQRSSRTDDDRVQALLRWLNAPGYRPGRVRAFQRTAGDEVQGVYEDPSGVVEVSLDLVRDGHWSVGVGIGAVRSPLPRSARAGSGPAFEFARTAVTRAKHSGERVAVDGAEAAAARQAHAVLTLLAALVVRRSEPAWEAVDLVREGLTQTEAATSLGISKQALSQRLQVGMWPHEAAVRPVAATLLAVADVPGSGR